MSEPALMTGKESLELLHDAIDFVKWEEKYPNLQWIRCR